MSGVHLKHWVSNILLGICSLMFCLVLGEIIIRWIHPSEILLKDTYLPDPFVGYSLVPNYQFIYHTPEFDCPIQINKNRNECYTLTRSK